MDLSKYRNKLIGSEEERAVSPVIGVVLMVAVTVILAAVIAAFVMDLGDDLGGSSATVSTEMGTNSDWLPDNTAGETYENGTAVNEQDAELAYVNHNSGDAIEEDNVRIVVRGEDGNSFATLESDKDWSENYIGIETNGEAFDAGTSYTLTAEADSEIWDSDSGEPAEEEITIQVIEISSESTIGESTLEVPDNSA